MSSQLICDCCDRRPATYNIQEKVRIQKWYGFGLDTWKSTYQLCEECWITIGALVRGDPRAEVARLYPSTQKEGRS